MNREDVYPLIAATMEHISEGILLADQDGEVIYTNPSALRLLSLTQEPRKLRDVQGVNLLKNALKAALEQGEADAAGRPTGGFVTFREFVTTQDNDRRCLEFHTGMVRCEARKSPLRVLIVRDYTHEQRYEAFFTQNHAGELITHDVAMIDLLERVEQIAPINVSVLLQGESGTGKTRLARMIHAKSARVKQPFIEINCAAIPENLLETELFGHVKGSFTGAHRDRIGRFQAANGGTVFLDEIGEIPLILQPKLLRALQDQMFEPVGSNKSVKVDIRVIAASNQDLKAMVQAKRFRADLYYRLAVIPLCVPPLRERPSDIRLLIDYFIEQVCLRLQISQPILSSDALHILMDYPWPGNVRELMNAIEHGVICAVDGQIVADSLPFDIRGHTDNIVSRRVNVESVDKEKLLTSLHATGWNRRKTAELLGVDRSTLWRWMQRLDIQMPSQGRKA